MRNLKRALSLALASVMLVGMMVVGTSAASYPDVDSNDNVEAISVLQAVGVMQGDADTGEFRPDDQVSRNEMAVIMARLLLGSDADSYVGTHPFTDVPAWADKYVAACYNDGIIKGMDETTYGGKETVTAQQAAAMMLRALGYEKLEGTGADWARPVVSKANEIRLFANVGSNPNAAMTRNQIAQLGLNTLKSDVVITSSGSNINLGDIGTITTDVKYDKVTAKNTDPDYDGSGDEIQQLCEKLYEDDLTLEPVTGDDFGRPGNKWVYDGDDVITVADKADRTYVGKVTAEDLYDDLSLRQTGNTANTVEASKVDVYTDGVSSNKKITEDDDSDGGAFGADGQTVEVYYTKGNTAADDKVVISIVSSFLGVVTDDSAKSGDKTGIRIDVSGVGSKFFETDAQYAEDDVVLLTMASGDVKEITGTPETISGETTRVGSSDKALTIDGQKYPQAARFGDADGDVIKGVASNSLAVGNTYTLYLDANGCYLAAVEDEDNTTTNLVYVFDARRADVMDTSSNEVKPQVMATVVEMDGTYRDVKIELEQGETVDGAVDDGSEQNHSEGRVHEMIGTFVNLNYDEDDKEYTLEALGQGDDYATTALPSTNGFELKADDRNTKFGGGNQSSTYYLNNKTVYLFIEVDDGDIDKVEIYTGGVDANVAQNTEGAVAHESNNRVGYVVIEAAYSASADDVIYIVDQSPVDNVKDGKTFKGYIVGQDSEEQEIAIQDGNSGANVIDAVGFYSYTTVKSNGNLDNLTKHASDETDYVVDKAIETLVDGDGTFDQSANTDVYDFSNAVVVDVRDNTDVYGEISSVSALSRAFDRDYTITVSAYINSDDEIVGLFITDVDEPQQGGGNQGGGQQASTDAEVKSATAVCSVTSKVTVGNPVVTSNEQTHSIAITVTRDNGEAALSDGATVTVTPTLADNATSESLTNNALVITKANNTWPQGSIVVKAQDGTTTLTYTVTVTEEEAANN